MINLKGLLQQLLGGIQGADIGGILNSLASGADVNAKDEQQNGMTPLQMAIMAGLTEIVKMSYTRNKLFNPLKMARSQLGAVRV